MAKDQKDEKDQADQENPASTEPQGGADVEPEVDATVTGETLDTTEAGTSSGAEAPHHKQNDPA